LAFVQAAASEQQFGYALTVARPLLNLVEVAMVRDQRLVSFFVGPIAHLLDAALFGITSPAII
jgi:hypothetical protein